jgi:hypothetical protein
MKMKQRDAKVNEYSHSLDESDNGDNRTKTIDKTKVVVTLILVSFIIEMCISMIVKNYFFLNYSGNYTSESLKNISEIEFIDRMKKFQLFLIHEYILMLLIYILFYFFVKTDNKLKLISFILTITILFLKIKYFN